MREVRKVDGKAKVKPLEEQVAEAEREYAAFWPLYEKAQRAGQAIDAIEVEKRPDLVALRRDVLEAARARGFASVEDCRNALANRMNALRAEKAIADRLAAEPGPAEAARLADDAIAARLASATTAVDQGRAKLEAALAAAADLKIPNPPSARDVRKLREVLAEAEEELALAGAAAGQLHAREREAKAATMRSAAEAAWPKLLAGVRRLEAAYAELVAAAEALTPVLASLVAAGVRSVPAPRAAWMRAEAFGHWRAGVSRELTAWARWTAMHMLADLVAPALTSVRFVKSHPPYREGELAGFDPAIAEDLMATGLAIFVAGPRRGGRAAPAWAPAPPDLEVPKDLAAWWRDFSGRGGEKVAPGGAQLASPERGLKVVRFRKAARIEGRGAYLAGDIAGFAEAEAAELVRRHVAVPVEPGDPTSAA